jgi:hypothetical protein
MEGTFAAGPSGDTAACTAQGSVGVHIEPFVHQEALPFVGECRRMSQTNCSEYSHYQRSMTEVEA